MLNKRYGTSEDLVNRLGKSDSQIIPAMAIRVHIGGSVLILRIRREVAFVIKRVAFVLLMMKKWMPIQN